MPKGHDTSRAPRYLTTADVAERFRTCPATVRYWRHTGYGPTGARFGRRVLYPLVEVERWEREIQNQPGTGR